VDARHHRPDQRRWPFERRRLIDIVIDLIRRLDAADV
jgi:hypothetical protein